MRPNSNSWTDRLVAALLLCGLAVGGPLPLLAQEKKGGLVESLIAAAQREFDAGNFARAGDLFLAIWRQDKSLAPTQLAAAYNAARSYQFAGNLEQAEELYRELAAMPNLPEAVRGKCDKQLGLIRERRADDKVALASQAEREGKLELAVSLWSDALTLVPSRRDWALRKARAQHLAGDRAGARASYRAWLDAAGPNEPQRADVERWLSELVQPAVEIDGGDAANNGKGEPGAANGPDKGAVQSSTQAKVEATPPAVARRVVDGPARWPGWLLLLGSAGAIGGGGWLLWQGRQTQLDLDDKLHFLDNDSKKIIGITKADADAQAVRISRYYTQGWIAAGVGGVGTVVSLYLLIRDGDTPVAVAPVGRGAVVTMRF